MILTARHAAPKLLLTVLLGLQTIPSVRAGEGLETPVGVASLDPERFSEWVDGIEKRVESPDGPKRVLWTKETVPAWDGVRFGESKQPGLRHLRIGFKTPISVGSVLVRAGGRLSVLKRTAADPGHLAVEEEWLPAQRLVGSLVSQAEVASEEYAVWVLPPGTTTQALRFSHEALTSDPNYAGWLGGAFILSDRYVNVAPQAVAMSGSREEAASKINNGSNDGTWGAWDNGPEGRSLAVSPEHPESVILTWPRPVALDGLVALWAGFHAAKVQAYTGSPERHPREAAESDWTTIKGFDAVDARYPVSLAVNLMGFGRPVTTRAIRVQITKVTNEAHSHLAKATREGRRVWLGELMALKPLGQSDLGTAIPTTTTPQAHPPIPVRFTLKEPGLVTLVIENQDGRRVRNLISETPFPAGQNIAWWDGMDDLLRDEDAARHGLYHIPERLVEPGRYRVRGLTRKPIELRYEFSAYTAGNPPWSTPDHKGGWLANHTPPSSALFVPASKAPGGKPLIYLGSYVSEGGDGLAWVDLDGHKQDGVGWVGGNWTGAQFLAHDAGPKAAPNAFAYVGSAWEGDLRLTALTPNGDRPVAPYKFTGGKEASVLTGLAAHNGVIVCSLPKQGGLLFVDAIAGKAWATTPLDDPRGLAFDSEGRLLVLSGHSLLRFTLPESLQSHLGNNSSTKKFPTPEVLINQSLDDPQQLVLDSKENIYISDRGASHQVKVFSTDGKFQHAIGHPGAPKAGPYDADHMNNPSGLAIDSKDRLWVTETDFQPKRVSVWTLNGDRVNAFYGPAEYGGGGAFDPSDKTRFYYHGMELKLDWDRGTSSVASILNRPLPGELAPPTGFGVEGQSETALYRNGIRYFTNAYNSNPTNGAPIALIWQDRQGIARPAAAFGQARSWAVLNFASSFSVRWTGQILAPISGEYAFAFETDNSDRMTIDGKPVITASEPQDRRRVERGKARLEAGKRHDVVVEYRKSANNAVAKLRWTPPGQPETVIPSEKLFSLAESSKSGGLTAHYFNDLEFARPRLVRIDPEINFDLLDGGPKSWPLPQGQVDGLEARLPAGTTSRDSLFFAWSDLNGDAQIQPVEVSFLKKSSGGITVMPDLAFVAARVDDQAVRFAPTSFTAGGIPVYDLKGGEILVNAAQTPTSSGGDQAIFMPDGRVVLTVAPAPFAPQSLGGASKGVANWSYPSPWPGLHASHESSVPDRPGQVIGTTRLLGGSVTPRHGEAGPIWGINGNMGNMYLFTSDGLFLATLFKDVRQGKPWVMPLAVRGMLVNDLTLHDENFWPSMGQTADGQIYLVAGNPDLVRIDGLETVVRLPESTLNLSTDDLKGAQTYLVESESSRRRDRGTGTLTVAIKTEAPVVDGALADWAGAAWADVDKRGVAANFNSNSKPYDVTAAVSVYGDRLFAAFRTGDPDLLKNSGESPSMLFKTGGALDLMIGANAKADPVRKEPVSGDIRLLVSVVKGKPIAMIYRAVVPGTKASVPFSSPWRTVLIDRVEDISSQIRLAQQSGDYELSVPLSALGLKPQPPQMIRADIGILRGNGTQTVQRIYWQNKATALTADVPSEAMLTPELWGQWRFLAPSQTSLVP